MPGEYGNMQDTYPLGSEKPDGPAALLAMLQRMGLNRGAGVALAADAAGVTSLFNDIDFTGFTAMQADTLQAWTRKAGATIPLPVNVRRQLDTANDTAGLVVQTGIGKITGVATTTISEAVTFPVAFSAIPFIVMSYTGTRAAGAFNTTGLTAGSAIASTAGAPSTSGFTALLTNVSALSATSDYYYSWLALGAP